MGVTEIHGDADWNANMQRAGGKLVVVDFSATWCGPCQFIKPVYHQLSSQYHDVVFLEVDEAQNRSLISALGTLRDAFLFSSNESNADVRMHYATNYPGVRGFPTFHFYVSQRKVDELVGADQNALRSKIEQWRQSAFNPFASAGMSLGGSAAVPTDAREARLRRFNNLDLVPPPADSKPLADAKANMVCDPNTGECHPMDAATGAATKEDEEEAKREQDAENSTELGIPPVNEEFLAQLLEMGFNELRARKSLLATDSQNLEAAISWIGEHQDDADIDEPIKFVDLSKHTKKPLTEEEKAAKIADLKARIEAKRVEREAREKRERIENEIKRRTMGQDMQNAKEEYDRIQRKLAAEKLKKEKEEYKLERERIRAKLEQDKLERRARGGYLGGAPIDLPSVETLHKSNQESENEQKKKASLTNLSPEEQVVANVEKLKKYRVGGDGLAALKTLNVYVKNLVEKPDDEKFRTINLENAAFRKRIASLVGGVAFLKSLGFEKVEEEGLLKLSTEKRDVKLLQFARTQVDAAIRELS